MKRRKHGLGLGFKKGNAVIDTAMTIILLMALALIVIFGKYITNEITADINADTEMSNTSKEMMTDFNDRYVSLYDSFFCLIFILLWCVVIVSSFMIDSHPIFFIFTILLLIGVFIAAAYIGNSFEDTIEDTTINTIALSFPITYWIMTHLLIVAIVIGFSVVLVLFGKNRFM